MPGIPLALARPDLQVTLVEPMLRRCDFLREVIDQLGADISLVRGRLEDAAVREQIGPVDVVVCRAVAALDKLIPWCMPLLTADGRLLAIKGERAQEEVTRLAAGRARLGAGAISVVRCGRDYLDPPATVVVADKGPVASRRQARLRGRKDL